MFVVTVIVSSCTEFVGCSSYRVMTIQSQRQSSQTKLLVCRGEPLYHREIRDQAVVECTNKTQLENVMVAGRMS